MLNEAAVRTAALELVVAVSENEVIGRGNQLPWRLPADLRHFKALTLGRSVLMGRKTHESIGRALPGRVNFVLSRADYVLSQGCVLVRSVDEALVLTDPETPLMVIGGAEVYAACLSRARRIHLTLVHAFIADGDTFFRGWRGAAWRETSRERHAADDANSLDFSFITLERWGATVRDRG